jgi:predicted anti-sigma-YlaC factor YlaD
MFQRGKSNKMDCRICREKTDDYREGKLANGDKLSFEEHLLNSPACLELLRMQEMADRIIAVEKSMVPDFYLPARIMQKIGNLEKEPAPVFIRILRPALATIALATAIMAGVIIGDFSAGTTDKEPPIELTLMNDAGLEMINVLTAE